METIAYIVLLSMATYRFAYAFAYGIGPWNCFENLRNAWINYPWCPFKCFNCTSMWAGLIIVWLIGVQWQTAILFWLASSTGAMLINHFVEIED